MNNKPTISVLTSKNNRNLTISYNGRESLLDLLDEAADRFLLLLDEAGARGWVERDFLAEFDVGLSAVVIKRDLPQSP